MIPDATKSCEESGFRVDRDGQVFSTISNWRGYGVRALVAHPGTNGYLQVRFCINGKRLTRYVHQLVAKAFLPPRPSPAHEVRHLDGNPLHNRAENLAWGTRKDNADDRAKHGRCARGERQPNAKLTVAKVEEIRQVIRSDLKVAKRFGVCEKTIWNIRRGLRWR